MVLSDQKILRRIARENMINPALTKAQEEGVISAGLSSVGYDVRIGYTFKIFRWVSEPQNTFQRKCAIDDIPRDVFNPKNPNIEFIEEVKLAPGEVLILGPYEYAIGPTIEYIRIPEDILVIILGKSTYARAGLIINCTPAEPGWAGYLAVEMFNATMNSMVIYPGEGICQFIFLNIDGEVLRNYATKEGKYQNQGKDEMLGKVK